MKEQHLKEKIVEQFWLDKFSGLKPYQFLGSGSLLQEGKSATREVRSTIPEKLVAKVNRASRQNPTGKMIFFISALKYAVFKYTRQTDIIVATPTLKLTQPENPAASSFLFFRSQIDPELTIQQMVLKIKEEVSQNCMYQSENLSGILTKFEKLKMGDADALFQIGLSYNQLCNDSEIMQKTAWFLEITEDSHGSYLTFRSREEQPQWLMKQFVRHYLHILEELLESSQNQLGQISVMSETDQEQLLENFNETGHDYPLDKTFVQLFEEQVEKCPEKVAVEYDGRSVTYEVLNKESNKLANYLLTTHGVKKEDCIGVMMERSERLIIGILGILKAGAVVVPVDIMYPPDRKKLILESSGADLLLSENHHLQKFDWNGRTLDLSMSQKAGDRNPGIDISNDNLAYLVYTSGSTGKPKGILQTHKCLVSVPLSLINYEKFTKGQRVLQFASIGFDVSVGLEINFALLSGGVLCMIREEYKHDLNLLAEFIADQKIEWFYLPSSALNNMLEGSAYLRSNGQHIRSILTGAERVKIGDRLSEFLNEYSTIELFNIYGPSETHYVTSTKVEKSAGRNGAYPSFPHIGKPIPHNDIFILDENEQLVPIGVEGEICVSGAGLARGYVDAPELTWGKFVKNPFLKDTVMYKTGDMGCWSPEGNISFIDRVDDQVKIRGYRVELPEIESVLNRHPAISSSIVLAPEQDGYRELIAYIIRNHDITGQELRDYLSESLPYYMVPFYYVPLSSFPLTGNDKVDKKALAELSGEWLEQGVEMIAPQTETEIRLSEIWKELLQRSEISLLDNFFDLGGHSLKATQLLHHVHQRFEVKLTVGEIYEYPTLKGLAGHVAGKQYSGFKSIPLVEEREFYDISYAQRRLWIIDQFEEDQVAYHMPGAYTMRNLDREVFQTAYRIFIGRHEILRTRLVMVEGEPRQTVVPAGNPDWQMNYKDLSKDKNRDQSVHKLAGKELQKPFDLYKGPMIRSTLIYMGEDKYVFFLTLHHIISDGWSLGIIVKELLTLYNALKKGKKDPLPPLKVQYKDYAAWHNNQLQGDNLQKLEDYWLNQFQGRIEPLNLPADYPRPEKKTSIGAREMFHLPADLSKKLYDCSKQIDASLFVTLVGIVKVFLHTMSQQEDIIVGSPIAGREHPELENQIGFYVNTLALRTRILHDDSFMSVLEKVRQNVFDAYDHSLYPFDQLVDRLNLKRDLSRTPLFDVMVVLQNNETGTEDGIELEGVTVAPYPLDFSISKFDLNFSFLEIGKDIHCSLEYNTDLFKKETMELLKDAFVAISEQLLSEPERKISDADLYQLLGKQNGSESTQSLSFNFN